jgi:hypothetical protein
VPWNGGERLLRRTFEPLGYDVAARSLPLDLRFPEWGASRYMDAEPAATLRLQEPPTAAAARKRRRLDSLPRAAGTAMTRYLRRGRPVASNDRHVFFGKRPRKPDRAT